MTDYQGRFKAVIFDMDGTLIEPVLDFRAIRAELEIDPELGILEALELMDGPERRRKQRLLLAREISAARHAVLMDGALDILHAVRSAGLKTALLTRNARSAMEMVLRKFPMQFDLLWAREQGVTKPRPEGILSACERLGVSPERTACVGDFLYDIQAANAAGAVSILLAREGRPGFADQARHVISDLCDLGPLLGMA